MTARKATLRWIFSRWNENRAVPSALLMGTQTGAATVEKGKEFPQKTENGTAFWPGNSAAGIIP